MKLRAEPKDVLIFLAFALFLLYMISLGVVNASSLTQTGYLAGLDPSEAFSNENITITIIFYLLAVVGVFVAVQSYFFDKEKGFGFILKGKKDKKYSRWLKVSEMKKELKEIDPKADTLPYGGIPMMSDGKKIWIDNGESHTLIVGATGSGKTVIVAKPIIKILAKAGESMIVTDPKAELYQETGAMLKERGYNVIVLNFREPANGNAWNPMTLPYRLYKEGNGDKAIELLDDLAMNILYEEKKGGSSDPFWEKSGADYFTGLSLGLFEDGTEEQVNLNSVNLMSSLGEERCGGPNNNYLKEYFNGKDPSRPAYINASGTVYAPDDTKGSIVSTFKQKVKLFSSRDNLSEMLSYSDFDMKDIGRKKTAVFIVIQDEKTTLHPLATIFIKQCYETLIDVAQENGGKLPYRTNFILDEFANMPPLKDISTMVTAARSRLIRFNFIIQNYSQLNEKYTKDTAEIIKGNCNIMYLISAEIAVLEEISKLCGEEKSKEKDKTSSTPLVTVSDLQRLGQFEIIIIRMRKMPFKTKFVPNFKIDWGRKYPEATFQTRERKEVALFDIREYVNKKKEEKMAKMLGEQGTTGTGMPNFPGMPFPNSNGQFTNPTGQFPPSSNPFMNNRNPAPFPDFKSQSPFPDFKSPTPNTGANNPLDMANNKVDVDELIKKIDAKIAELEAEEKAEEEKKKDRENSSFKLDDFKSERIIDVKEESKDSKYSNMYEDNTDDDKFFDDFFHEDD